MRTMKGNDAVRRSVRASSSPSLCSVEHCSPARKTLFVRAVGSLLVLIMVVLSLWDANSKTNQNIRQATTTINKKPDWSADSVVKAEYQSSQDNQPTTPSSRNTNTTNENDPNIQSKEINHNDAPTTINHRQRRPLPNMTKGGMIFFLHVPKTGGSTVRYNFGRAESEFHQNVEYIVGNWKAKIDCQLDYIRRFLNNTIKLRNNKKVLFLEVHGMDSYSALELQPILHEWRQLAQTSGIPFFAFTVLREAVSAQVSFFNFFHIYSDCRYQKIPDTTSSPSDQIAQELLVPWSYENPQCLFLSRGERVFGDQTMDCYYYQSTGINNLDDTCETVARRRRRRRLQPLVKKRPSQPMLLSTPTTRKPNAQQVKQNHKTKTTKFPPSSDFPIHYKEHMEALRANLTQAECRHVYSVLQDSMDWIGVMERIDEETFPMLTQMIYNNAAMAGRLEWDMVAEQNHHEMGKMTLHLTDIGDDIWARLREKSLLDDELHRRASKEYTTIMWANFDTRNLKGQARPRQ